MSIDEAFDIMGRRLAGLTAAVEGFAARQQELHARDHSEELAKIHARCEAMRVAINQMDKRPAMSLTPALIAEQIERAGREGREDDHRAWHTAKQHLQDAVRSIGHVTLSARRAEEQRRWLGVAAGVAIIIGFFAGCTVPPVVDRTMPESWHWPERRAASIMHRDGWDAGQRLLQVTAPEKWNALVAASRLSAENSDALSACAKRALKKRKSVSCRISLPMSGTYP